TSLGGIRMTIEKKTTIAALVLAVMLATTSCSVSVDEKAEGKDKKVEITTPAGELKVRTSEELNLKEIGLPEYPGARRTQDQDESSAHVSISSALFGLKVVAAKFESDDSPKQVLAFYRPHLEKYGKVTECHGDVDFQGESGSKEIVCKPGKGNEDETELVVGSGERFRVVGVQPRGKGSQFGLAYVTLREGRERM
ncbi:MAG: hypothetical protein ACRESV_05495, partial [Nevskiales bacterium]